MTKSQITNHKSQTNSKLEIKNSKRVLDFGFWDLFGIWNLEFGISRKKGISLIEVVVYVALLGLLAVSVSNFLIHTVNTYNRARAEREVISNGRLLLETVNQYISESRGVYGPTSRFNQDAGQLALFTSATTTPEHSSIYIDFWIDNGRLFMRREGGSATPISAVSVRVTRFRVERIIQWIGREAIKITLQVDYNTSNPIFATSATLNSTTALRGNY